MKNKDKKSTRQCISDALLHDKEMVAAVRRRGGVELMHWGDAVETRMGEKGFRWCAVLLFPRLLKRELKSESFLFFSFQPLGPKHLRLLHTYAFLNILEESIFLKYKQ
jgi:hypothetical protein